MKPAYERNGQPTTAQAFYALACDPQRSVAVEACAGAGKTWMLVSRILRALLEGCAPQDILAITFTKKAAGEMRQRLQQWLEEFSRASPEQALQQLMVRGIDAPAAQGLVEPLQNLYQAVLTHGRPVPIRTFHSWFAALLRSAPLAVLQALGLPVRYELLESDDQAVAAVWPRFYDRLLQHPEARADFDALVQLHGRSQADAALRAVLARRVEFLQADQHGHLEDSVPHFTTLGPTWAGLDHPLDQLLQPAVRDLWLHWARALGQEKNKTPQSAAGAVIDALAELRAGSGMPDQREASRERAFALLRKAFFVEKEDRLTKNLQKFPAAQAAQAQLQQLCVARCQHLAWAYHQRMVRLGRILLAEFAALKYERGWVDMNDLEQAARHLLSDPVLGGWIQERLDVRIRHLLIDEFQDTNPMQWQALHAWLSAYAGAGAGKPPSLFIVGDPKQSIYRFRRAEPQVFRAAQQFIRDLGGDLLSCDHTRRNAPALIERVNAVMMQAQDRGDYQGFRPHTTDSQAAGQWLALPPITRDPQALTEDTEDTDEDEAGSAQSAASAVCADTQDPLQAGLAWRDSLTVPRREAEETLRQLECRQAAAWLAQQMACGLPPNQVLVLARKRDRLAVMQSELRALGIASLQPETADLGESPVVQDLVALMDALISPSHDLSLARALKSPIFGLTDADLVRLAQLQRTLGAPSWRVALQNKELTDDVLKQLEPVLARWSGWLGTLPPHDALEAIVHDGDLRARYAAASPPALRSQMLAHLDALLSAALQLNGGRYVTPYTLVRALKAGGIAAPDLADTHAVQLLTIHGAKGLEASCVVLLDMDALPPRSPRMGVLVDWPGEVPAPLSCAFLASESEVPPSLVPLLEREQQARAREELNGLYVALTRAKHTLVLSSVEPHRRSADCLSWWQRLFPQARLVGAPGSMPSAPQRSPAQEPQPPIVLSVLPQAPLGKGMGVMEQEADARPSGPVCADSLRSRIGQAMHRLLERASLDAQDFTPAEVSGVAREFELDMVQAAESADMARRILCGAGRWAWSSAQVSWHANEVPMVVGGRLRRIDRLVCRQSGQWWVLDYKSASDPAQQDAARAQLRAYRDAVRAGLRDGPASGAEVRVGAAFLTAQGDIQILEDEPA